MDIKKVLGRCRGFTKTKLPTIMSAFAATTSIGALIMAVKAEKKAQERISKSGCTEAVENEDGYKEYVWNPPSKKQERLIYLDEFGPVVLVEIMSLVGIFVGEMNNQKRIAYLSNALSFANARTELLERQVEKAVGKEKLDKIKKTTRDDLVDEKIKEFDALPAGSYLFYDPWYKRFFVTTEKNFLRAVNAANSIFECEDYITLGTFYYYLDIQPDPAAMVEGFTCEQVIEDWGECKIPIAYHLHTTSAGAKYYVIEYNCDVRAVLTSEEVLISYYG